MVQKAQSVFITGLGAVCSQGRGLKAALDSLLIPESGRLDSSGLSRSAEGKSTLARGRPFTDADCLYDRSVSYAMLATQEAMSKAGLLDNQNKRQFDPRRTGMALTGALPFPGRLNAASGSGLSTRPGGNTAFPFPPAWLEDVGLTCCDKTCICTDGKHVLKAAIDAIGGGAADTMIVGGADVVKNTEAEKNHDPSGQTVPPGEGAAFMVIESSRALNERTNKPLCRISSVNEIKLTPDSERDENKTVNSLSDAIDETLARAGIWEGDLGAMFITSRLADCGSAAEQILRMAMEHFASLPIFPVSPAIGNIQASALPLQCAMAAMIVNSQTIEKPHVLDRVKNEIEFWVEYRPKKLMGKSVMLIDTASDSPVAALLTPAGA